VLEEACRDADGDVPTSISAEAAAPSIIADTSGAAARNGTASEKASSENMDELYEEYRRWKQEQERKKLVADRAARRAMEQPAPAPPPVVPIIEEVDPRCAGDAAACEGSLAGDVFVDDEGDTANAFLVEDLGTGALVEIPVERLHRVMREALPPTETEAEVQQPGPEAAVGVPPAEEDRQDSKAMPAPDEHRKTMTDAPAQQTEQPAQQTQQPDADAIRRKLLEDRKKRRDAAAANRKVSEAIDQVDDSNADADKSTEVLQEEAVVEASTVRRAETTEKRDPVPSDAETLREKMMRDRASRKAAERARRKAESDNNREAAPESHDVAAAAISTGRQTILKRSTEEALRFFCDSSCPLAQCVWICLEEKGIAYEYVPRAQKASGTEASSPKYPVFAPASPLGLVPALEYTREPGLVDCIQDTMACMEYVDEAFEGPALLPAGNPALRARVRAWCSFANAHIVPLCSSYISASTKSKQDEEEVLPLLLERLEAFGQAMAPLQAEELSAGTGAYFLGETFSMVDITLFPWWWRLIGVAGGSSQIPNRDAFDRLRAWGDTCGRRPSVGNTLMTG